MARAALAGLAVVVLAGILYTTRLGDSPIYMMHDETQFALQAQSIASSGRDLGGRFMPVFFSEPEFPAGRDPVIIYASAAVLRFLAFSEGSARLATALVGVLDVLLVFMVTRRLFKSDVAGGVGAALMALTPAHFIRARLGLSPLYAVPFVLLWLLALLAYEDRRRARRLALGGAWLGFGVYTYLASVVMMPVYLGLTCLLALRTLNVRAAAASVAAFIVALVPMIAWHVLHPERFGQVFGSYREFSTTAQLSLLEGIQARIGMYWAFFDPEFLFMTGDTSLVNSTRLIGFFPMAFIVLLPAGLYAIWKSGRPVMWIIGIGLLTAPLASIVSGASEMNRIMYAIPFGVLTAVVGVMALLSAGGWRRGLALALLASAAWQFAVFQADYFGGYRGRSAPWLGGNLRAAMINVIGAQQGQSAPIYISAQIPFASRYWRFNALREQRAALIDAPIYYSEPPQSAPGGAILLCQTASAECAQLSSSAEWRVTFVATEPDQTASFNVLTRQPDR